MCGFLLIAVSTLYPLPGQALASAATPLLCLVCGQGGGQDIVLNLCLFAPFAIGLRILGWPWIRVALLSGVLSFTVESLQYWVVPGRDPSLSDVVTNTTGGALAAALAPASLRSIAPTPPSARLLFLGAFFWLAVQGLSAWLLSPWIPQGKLWSGWANPSPVRAPFHGHLRLVRLDGTPMPVSGWVPRGAEISAQLNHGSANLEVVGISGAPENLSRWVYSITNGAEPMLALHQEGRQVYFAVPARALQLHLIPPTIRMPDGFPGEMGRPFRVSAGESDRRLSIASSYDQVHRSFSVSLSPSQGWSLLDPFGFALGPEARLLTALWLGGLFLPLGFWARRSGRPWVAAITLGGTMALGLGVIPYLGGYPPVQWSDWLAGLVGSVAGWALHALASYLQTRCVFPSSNEFSSS